MTNANVTYRFKDYIPVWIFAFMNDWFDVHTLFLIWMGRADFFRARAFDIVIRADFFRARAELFLKVIELCWALFSCVGSSFPKFSSFSNFEPSGLYYIFELSFRAWLDPSLLLISIHFKGLTFVPTSMKLHLFINAQCAKFN